MDFGFGTGDEELGVMATGRVLPGEDESSLSGFGVKQTTYKLVGIQRAWRSCLAYDETSGGRVHIIFIYFIF